MTGWGTFFYGLVAGVCLAIALIFILIGARRRRIDPLMLSFAAFAVVSAISAISITELHRASSIADYADAFGRFGFIAFLGAISLVGLVAVWTAAIPRPALVVWGVASAVIGVLQVSLTDGLLTGPITELRTVTFLGEAFVVHVSSDNPWRPLLDAYLIATLGLIVFALVRGYRSGRRETAAVVSGALFANLIFGLWDSAVDAGRVDTPYLAPIGSLIALLGGAAYLAERTVRLEERLERQSAGLEELVAERTTDLGESNRLLGIEIKAQRDAAESLSLLTNEFEASNRIVEVDSAAIAASLQSLVGHLATTAPIVCVELQLHEVLLDGQDPTTFTSGEAVPGDTAPDHSEPLRVGTRTIGELRAWHSTTELHDRVETEYLSLAAEHLSGLFHRLELVRHIAISAVEDERQRIARDLHDSVTQRMYSVSFLADALVHHAEADDAVNTSETAGRVRELVISSLAELRSLLFELQPSAFDETPLPSLLEQLGEHAAATSTLRIDVEAQLASRLPPEVKAGLYRITQEALSNACRHSGGEVVRVTLAEADGVASLVIEDDGDGFDRSSESTGRGLANLRGRASQVGADLDITSTPGVGTVVEARWARQPSASELVGIERSE